MPTHAERIASLTEEVRSLTAVDTTKKEWQEALTADLDMLRRYEGYLKKLNKGEKVENLTADRAKHVIEGLKTVIKNKKRLIQSIA